MKRTVKRMRIGSVPIFPDFLPLRALWDGPDAPFPSEYAARWNFRRIRPELAKAGAVIAHGHAYLIHPQRFAEVLQDFKAREFAKTVERGTGHGKD